MPITPKKGDIWKKEHRDGSGHKMGDSYCYVVEEGEKVLGVWLGVAWKPEDLNGVEHGKEGWKKIFPNP